MSSLFTTWDDITVPVVHLFRSETTFGADLGGWTASETYLCDWKDANSLIVQCAGGKPVSVGAFIVFSYPVQFPENTLVPLFATSISCKGMGVGDDSKRYDRAEVSIAYASVPWDTSKEYSETWQGSTTFATVPNGFYRFEGSGFPINTPQTARIVEVDIRRVYRNVTTIGFGDIMPYIGAINSAGVGPFAAETLLVQDPSVSYGVNFNGSSYEVALSFRWRPYSWNKALDPSTGALDYYSGSTGGGRQYQTADITPIFPT